MDPASRFQSASVPYTCVASFEKLDKGMRPVAGPCAPVSPVIRTNGGSSVNIAPLYVYVYMLVCTHVHACVCLCVGCYKRTHTEELWWIRWREHNPRPSRRRRNRSCAQQGHCQDRAQYTQTLDSQRLQTPLAHPSRYTSPKIRCQHTMVDCTRQVIERCHLCALILDFESQDPERLRLAECCYLGKTLEPRNSP